jgi:hypothetical protein
MLGTESAVKTQLGKTATELEASHDGGKEALIFAARIFKDNENAVVKITDDVDGIPPEAATILKVHSQRSSARQFSVFLNTIILWLEDRSTKTFEIDTVLEHRRYQVDPLD